MHKSKKILFICCDHGLGHTKRVLILANSLAKQCLNVTIFADISKVSKLLQKLQLSYISFDNIVDLRTRTTIQLFSGDLDNILSWTKGLPDLNDFDLVICDNLPEILLLRTDAILLAQFFWHDALDIVCRKYVELCSDLLKIHKPIIFGIDRFSMPIISSSSNYKPIGIVYNPSLVRMKSNNDRLLNLLITGGSTSIAFSILSNLVQALRVSDLSAFQSIYLDPMLYSQDLDSKFIKASYDYAMFSRINSAIIRPGLGIVCDLLSLNVRLSVLCEENNKEIIFNTDQLVKSKLATRFDPSSFSSSIDNLKSHPQFKSEASYNNISDGSLDFTEKVLSLL